MSFTKKQKIAIIISLWLYFLWIVSICFTMRAQFKGKLINCIIIGGTGCGLIAFLYLFAFSGAYYIPKIIKNKENIGKIKRIYRTSNIIGIYVGIVGFFSLSLSVLLLDQNKIRAFRLAWFIIIAALFFIAILLLSINTYRRITSAVRTFAFQEKNESILSEATATREEK